MIPSLAAGQSRKCFAKVAIDSSINLWHALALPRNVLNMKIISCYHGFPAFRLVSSLMNAVASGTCAQPAVASVHNGVISTISAHCNFAWLKKGVGGHTVTSDCSRQHAPSHYEPSSTFHLKEYRLLEV